MTDWLVKPGTVTRYPTRGMTSDAIRQFISLGMVLEPHETEVTTVPGIEPTLLQQPQAMTTSLRSFIPTNLPGMNQLPGGVVTDWGPLIRTGIDILLGKLGGDTGGGVLTPLQGPLVLPPGSGTPGVFPPGGIAGLPSGGFVLGRGRVPFITMPNGLPGCPSGYHPEKQGEPYCVRNRRMNPLNPRALSRASRRVGGFARAVKRARTLKKVCRTL